MSNDSFASTVDEINRLHSDAAKVAAQSRQHLHEAMAAAWRAGRLLLTEKKRVCRAMGRSAWPMWLEQNFRGSPAAAQRYLRVADSIADEALLRGLSIRQTYLRLGIATEPKSRAQTVRVPALPAYLRFASRLLVALHQQRDFRKLTPTKRNAYKQDLRPLYAKLRVLFESVDGKERVDPALCF
jgi:hypothetical protein